VLTHLALRARVVICGAISSGYTAERKPGPSNYLMLIVARARMEGFLVLDYVERFPEAIQALAGWVAAGKIAFELDVAEGLENAPKTLNRLFTGKNFGKQLLKIAD
jgi:NADPH-dependent curcumin reductase